MKTKRYNPVKVKDPVSDGHSVRLQPQQAFSLVLTKIFENDSYDVELKSDYLVLERIESDKETNQDTYFFSQKYNLSAWSLISNVFLGNVIIKHRNDSQKEDMFRLCVFLDCCDMAKTKVVTVINPDKHLIKVEPCQVLHVVICDQHARWTLVGIEDVGMNCARSETVFNDQIGVYDPGYLFCSEPRNVNLTVNNELTDAYSCVYQKEYNDRQARRVSKEYHFWTHFSLESLRRVHHMTNGSHQMGKLRLSCKDETGKLAAEREAEVVMAVRGSGKKLDVQQFQAIRYFGRNWNLRYCSADRTTLLCPNIGENLDINADKDSLYVEIPAPAVYFNCDPTCYWYSEVNLDSMAQYGMRVQELTQRHVNGYAVQRFVITNISKTAPAGDLTFIGAIRFMCKLAKETNFIPPGIRSMSMSLWKLKRNATPMAERTVFKPPCHTTNNGVSYYRPTQRTQDRPIGWIIDLEQKALESLSDDTTFVKLMNIDPDVKTYTYDAYEDYYGCMGAQPTQVYSSKKKRNRSRTLQTLSTATTHTDCSTSTITTAGGNLQGSVSTYEGYETAEEEGEKETWQDAIDDWYKWLDMA